MQQVIIQRRHEGYSTYGSVFIDGEFFCYSLELQWDDNKNDVSCIPSGTYTCRLRWSNKFKRNLYEVTNVPDRENILIHVGNFAGDVSAGLKSSTQGCILLGKKFGLLHNQFAILNSGEAVRAFEKSLDYKPFILTIKD